jgi:nucleoside-diphosphate-sugar epimerase
VRVVYEDVMTPGLLDDVFATERPTHVYNLVGDTFVPSAYVHPRRFLRINAGVCLELLLAVARHGIERMLHVSSTEVYGRAETQPIDESHPLRPVNTYAVTKVAADRLCHTFVLEHGVPVVIARIFNCYGPRETQPYVVPEIVRQLVRGPRVVLGDVEARRDFTFVEDTARGLRLLMDAPVPDGEVAHVGSGRSVSIREVAERVGRVLGYEAVEIETDPERLRRAEIDEFRCDATRLREATGWTPEVDLDAGLARTIDWYRANGSRWCWEAWCPDGVIREAPRPAAVPSAT